MSGEKQSQYVFIEHITPWFCCKSSLPILISIFSVISWDSKMGLIMSRCLFSTTFISSYYVSLIPVFCILKLYSIGFDILSSCIQVKSNIWHLNDDLFPPSHTFTPVRCHIVLQTIIVYQWEITKKKRIGKSR